MKILYVDQFSEIGGAQKCMLDLIPAFQARGWRVHAALPGNGIMTDRLRLASIEFESIRCGPYRSGRKSLLDFARFAADRRQQTAAVSRLTARHNFDLIYVNGPRVLSGALNGAGDRTPVLFHAHNHLKSYGMHLTGQCLRAASIQTVACCESVAAPLRSYVPGSRIQVIPNGTAAAPFRTRGYDPDYAGLRIGIIGRIQPEKGQLKLLEAAALLIQKLPGMQIVFCGNPAPGGGSYFERVRRLAGRLPVEFLGWRDDIGEVLNELDLLVIASELEGLPRVMLEAFSAGVPVMAFDTGGIAEAIQDDATGFLVANRSAVGLASRILALATGDRRLMNAVAANARRRWEERYQVKIFRSRIMDAVERAASGRILQPSGT